MLYFLILLLRVKIRVQNCNSLLKNNKNVFYLELKSECIVLMIFWKITNICLFEGKNNLLNTKYTSLIKLLIHFSNSVSQVTLYNLLSVLSICYACMCFISNKHGFLSPRRESFWNCMLFYKRKLRLASKEAFTLSF